MIVGGVVTVVRVSSVVHDKLVIITGQFNGNVSSCMEIAGAGKR